MRITDSGSSETSYFRTQGMGAGYGRKLIIDGVELTVGRGEIVTLIGPNGSGKSTVLRSIIGQLKLIKGAVFLDGRNMEEIGGGELARTMSVLMTDRIKTELMTCYDIVATARYPYTGSLGLLTDDDRRIVSEALDTVNAKELADEDFGSVSDGQRQRILLARCIAQEPELIVLDEPTSFLDIKYKIELLQILKMLAKEKDTAIIMSMHEIDFARQISDKAVCIGSNGIDRIGTPMEVLTPEYLCRLFDISYEAYSAFFGEAVNASGSVENKRSDDNGGNISGNDKEPAGYVSRNGKLLRKGITTGTCATAAAYGAVTMLLTGEAPDSVSVLTPSGENVSVDIIQSKASSENNSDISDTVNITQNKTQPQMDRTAEFYVIKDSGDDPDITNGAKVYVKVQTVDITQSADLQLYSSYDRKTEESKSDQVSVTDNCFTDDTYHGIYIAGGEGVGIVTKEGLEQPVGYPAINKVPRRMIFETVDKIKSEAGYDGSILITVSVENGRELAAKTFNPELGIEGGISILGTSGILEPMSDKAIVDTIEALIKQQAALGRRTLLVTPGQYGQGYVRNELKIDVADSIKCSNFIGDAIDIAVSYDFTHVLLVGNLGKLIKLAAGIMNTHSRVADGRMDVMCTHLAMCGGTADMVRRMYECINTDSALDKLKEWDLYDEVLGSIISMIHKRLVKRAGDKLRIGAFVFSEKYGYLGETEFAGEALKAYCEEAKAE